MRSRVAIFLVCMVLLLSFPKWSDAQWKQVGNPKGGWITDLLVSGANIFAATREGGVFLSKNDGASWEAVNSGLPKKIDIQCLAVSGTNLFAGTPDGIFISADNGKNWTATGSAEDMHTAYCFAASGTNIFGGAWCGVLLSTNNGKTWTFMDIDIPRGPYLTVPGKEDYVRSLAVSGENFVAGTGYERFVFVSRWNGKSWETVSSDSPENLDVDCVALNGKYLFAGTSRGVFLSKNKGKSWIERNSGLPKETQVWCFAMSGKNLFIGTSKGVFLSRNNGKSWRGINPGLTIKDIPVIAISGANLFAGTHGRGIWRLPLQDIISEKQ